MGSIDTATYSVPHEARKVFENGIIHNPLLPTLPPEIEKAAELVTFTGSDLPSVPINWRQAESAAALKALEASLLNVLRHRKYNVPLSQVTINTDHAPLFVMSPLLDQLEGPDGTVSKERDFGRPFDPTMALSIGIKNTTLSSPYATLHRGMATNIYRTKDGRFYHTHGNLDPEPTLKALGFELESEIPKETYAQAAEKFQRVVEKYDSKELDTLMNDDLRQAGTICYSTKEFEQTEHGKANAHVGLYELVPSKNPIPNPSLGSWWPDSKETSPKRPLAGLKVLDFTRILAGPTIGRSLAEMGASVMRVTSQHVTDAHNFHLDLNWGKWNTHLHLPNTPDRAKLDALLLEADVVVDGYRPGVLAKYGISREALFALAEKRGKPIIHARENCYGWHGPWQKRSGWQQISDAVTGVSLSFGRSIGVDEPVTPGFPNSDYATGIIGSCAVLHALLTTSSTHHSHGIDTALNYYSSWLVRSVSTYPPPIWADLWARHGRPTFRHTDMMAITIPKLLTAIWENPESKRRIFDEEFFEVRETKALGGARIKRVRPIARWEGEEGEGMELGFNVGTRGNGVDEARWPEDLMTEVVR